MFISGTDGTFSAPFEANKNKITNDEVKCYILGRKIVVFNLNNITGRTESVKLYYNAMHTKLVITNMHMTESIIEWREEEEEEEEDNQAGMI